MFTQEKAFGSVWGGVQGASPDRFWERLLRSTVTGRVGLVLFAWVLLALVLRPLMLAAHEDGAGPLASWAAGLSKHFVFAKMVAVAQWFSLMLPPLAIAMIQARLNRIEQEEGATLLESQGLRSLLFPGLYAGVLFLGYICFVWSKDTTFTFITNDSLIFFDAAYRIDNGEIPHVDFPTALGAATLYLPALGVWLADGFAGSIELASCLLFVPIALAVIHAGYGRFPVWITSCLVAIVFLIVVPAVILGIPQAGSYTFESGEPLLLSEGLTHAMFYNRWGWAALIPAFMYLAPRRDAALDAPSKSSPSLPDVLILASIICFLFYTKITFAMAACAAAALYAGLGHRPLRTLGIGVAASITMILMVGVPSGLLWNYVLDLRDVAMIAGGKTESLPIVLRQNFLDLILASVPLAMAAMTGRLKMRDGLVGGAILLLSFYVLLQNAQYLVIPTLLVLAAYGLVRVGEDGDRIARAVAAGAFCVLALSPFINRSLGLLEQIKTTRIEEVRSPAPWAELAPFKNVFVAERENTLSLFAKAGNDVERYDALHTTMLIGRKEILRQGEYMSGIYAGVKELEKVVRPGDSVATLDMANPFPFLMGLRSAKGSFITLDSGRTISADHHPEAQILFADSDHVMIPRFVVLQDTADLVYELYDPWLTANYEERSESLYWYRYSRRKAAD